MGFRLFTFDPDDAKRYNLQLTRQFYRQPQEYQHARADTDRQANHLTDKPVCFFCGENKGRKTALEQLAHTLENHGLVTDFIIVDEAGQYISYEDYLSHLATCQFLVDWVQADQAGITRRPVEALFWQKKLITNHRQLLQSDFYRPENIFIVGHDDPGRLPQFIREPFVAIPPEIQQRYDVNHWLLHF